MRDEIRLDELLNAAQSLLLPLTHWFDQIHGALLVVIKRRVSRQPRPEEGPVAASLAVERRRARRRCQVELNRRADTRRDHRRRREDAR